MSSEITTASGKSFSSDLIKELPTNPAPPVTNRVRLNVFPIFRSAQRRPGYPSPTPGNQLLNRYYAARP
ncbi:hypothetical protein GCM10010112_08760 [Actinoplanes lobatus]|nr:hypothetical protein GCM10010112_08760 [Actinoplanes lobatus]